MTRNINQNTKNIPIPTIVLYKKYWRILHGNIKRRTSLKKKKKEVRWTFSNLVIRLQSHTCKSYKLKDLAMYAHNSNPLVMTRVISCTKSRHYRSEPTSKSCLQSQFLQIGKLNENKIRTNLNKRAFSKICHWLGAFR